ncbi:MAG: hypothetical protein KBI46_04810 [Phycisphaerae bacterium]|nr:hypothetical protein [Phycisphaerae bacterium]
MQPSCQRRRPRTSRSRNTTRRRVRRGRLTALTAARPVMVIIHLPSLGNIQPFTDAHNNLTGWAFILSRHRQRFL